MKTSRFASLRVLSLLPLCLFFASVSSAQHYTITDIGAMTATGVNAFGQVAGTGGPGASLWTKQGGIQYLGSLFCCSGANAINDLGHVTGVSWIDESDNAAFLWTPEGGMQEATFVGDGQGGFAINNFDEIGGQFSVEPPQPFVWTQNGGITNLYSLLAEGIVYGINDHGQAVGFFFRNGDTSHAFLMNKAQKVEDLGPGQANAINFFGDVVGFNGENHAFLWNRGTGMEDLGTLPGDASSYASALNVFDIVVGTSTSSDLEVNRAFVWTKRTGMIDLNTLLPPDSGWTLTNATGINIFGQIVGNGTINGQTNAFLLTLK
ncbi:MAG: hypothetical protein ABSC33_01465 [Candidatus Sulfotelmatobacter sp.]|jgi:probable HAF family extracellular repeat protein